MKTLEEIKEEVAINHGFKSYNRVLDYVNSGVVSGFSFADLWNDITESYATEYAKEALKNASKGFTPAKIVYNEKTRSYDKVASVKDILSESNLPKH